MIIVIVGTVVMEVSFWSSVKKKHSSMGAFFTKTIFAVSASVAVTVCLGRVYFNLENYDWTETEAIVTYDEEKTIEHFICYYDYRCETSYDYAYKYDYTDMRTGMVYNSDLLYSSGHLPSVIIVRFDPEHPDNSVEGSFADSNLNNILLACFFELIAIGVWLVPVIIEKIKNKNKKRSKNTTKSRG
jgi:hypothetical protein